METSFLKLIEHSIKEHWHLPSLTDYEGAEHNYKDVARWIEKLHILFEKSGIQPGDKVALCSRNTSNWGIAFFATLTYGAVAVPILNEFKPDTIHHIINHSSARLLFVGKSVWDNIDHESMPMLDGIIAMADYSVISSRNTVLAEIAPQLETLFKAKYPEELRNKDIHYRTEQPEELAMINYTSGTTSSPKGVMLPYRSMWSNLRYALDQMGYAPGEKLVSILTMAHMIRVGLRIHLPFRQWNTYLLPAKNALTQDTGGSLCRHPPAPDRRRAFNYREDHQKPGTPATGKVSYQADAKKCPSSGEKPHKDQTADS